MRDGTYEVLGRVKVLDFNRETGWQVPAEKGDTIGGLEAANQIEGVTVFHAGTRKGEAGVEAAGGRVLNVTATGSTVQEARDRAYKAVEAIDWPGGFNRTDIAWRILGT